MVEWIKGKSGMKLRRRDREVAMLLNSRLTIGAQHAAPTSNCGYYNTLTTTIAEPEKLPATGLVADSVDSIGTVATPPELTCTLALPPFSLSVAVIPLPKVIVGGAEVRPTVVAPVHWIVASRRATCPLTEFISNIP